MNIAEKFTQFLAEKKNEPTELNGRVLLIDGLNTYLRAFSSSPTMDENGRHIGGITGFLLSIGAAIRTLHPSRVVIVFDGKGGSQRRRHIFPAYKNNRRTMTRLNRTYDFGTVEDEKQALQWQLVLLVEALQYLPVTIIHPDNVEADDVLAYLAQTVKDRGGEAIILSTDKDFIQLIDDKIHVWHPTKKEMLTIPGVIEKYGFHPTNFLLYRVITGDKSDNIPGVRGIKEKTLLKIFPELSEAEKRDIEYIVAQTQQKIEETKKPSVALKTLNESQDILERNFSLMRLDDVAMSGTTRLLVLEKFDSPVNDLNKYQLTKTIQSAKLMTAFKRWDEWVASTFFPLLRFSRGDNS